MKIIVLANKWWECEAMLSAMLNCQAYPPPPPSADKPNYFPWCDPGSLASPRSRTTDAYNPTSRATFSYKQDETTIFTVEVWSVSDLLEAGSNSSSSGAKAKQLKAKLFKPDGV